MNIKNNRSLSAIGKAVKNVFKLLKYEIHRAALSRNRHLIIERYMESNSIRKLHLGCGPNELPGWLNTDLSPVLSNVIYIDISDPLPVPDGSFDYIYSEHLIEHVAFESGLTHLKECHRVLNDKGTLRLSTPDIQFLIDYYKPNCMSDVQLKYLNRVMDDSKFGNEFRFGTTLINVFMRKWGHQFIYDEEILKAALKHVGFADIRRCSVNESEKPDLRRVERHGISITNEFNNLQSLILEANK
jgi:predicted SAM-dependent methyltransferase